MCWLHGFVVLERLLVITYQMKMLSYIKVYPKFEGVFLEFGMEMQRHQYIKAFSILMICFMNVVFFSFDEIEILYWDPNLKVHTFAAKFVQRIRFESEPGNQKQRNNKIFLHCKAEEIVFQNLKKTVILDRIVSGNEEVIVSKACIFAGKQDIMYEPITIGVGKGTAVHKPAEEVDHDSICKDRKFLMAGKLLEVVMMKSNSFYIYMGWNWKSKVTNLQLQIDKY